MTTRDIEQHIKEIYGFNASHSLISDITEKILPHVRQRQKRPLETIYVHILMDAKMVELSIKRSIFVLVKMKVLSIG